MVTVIKQGASQDEIDKIFAQMVEATKTKGIDAYKYCGTVKFKEDGLDLQKRLRNEWE